MGVRGLTTYINNNQDVFMKKYYLHDTNLVIDGHSLCAQLYIRLNSFSAFGGDYDRLSSFIKTFFKNLQKCNVTSYVIFDGCHESRKLKTVLSRLKSKLNGASRLDPVTQDSLHIFPFLVREVFREVLVANKISYTVCEFEADDEIASLARYLNCPVLSYDSDFFIYNVLYIPFNTLEIKAKPIDVDGKKVQAMECKLYKVQYLCKHFGGLHEDLLPLLATLLGNDFVEKKVFKKFYSQLKLPKCKRNKNEQQRSIHALFNWLQNETLDSAVAKILGRLKKYQKNRIFLLINKSIDGYHSKYCKSVKYFNVTCDNAVLSYEIKLPNEDCIIDESVYSESGEDEESSSEVISDEENSEEGEEVEEIAHPKSESLPDWFTNNIRNNLIPTVYLNLYVHQLHICNPQAEDYDDKDSFLCALSILRFAFDILTDFSYDDCVYISREKCNYKRVIVGRDYSVPRLFEVPFQDLAELQKQSYFKNFFDIKLQSLDYTLLNQLPVNFQLFMMSILWWISYCSVPAAHVHSLLMAYIMLEVIDEKTGASRGHFLFNNRHAKKLNELRENPPQYVGTDGLFLNKNKVQYEDCLIAASVLLKHFEIDDTIRKKPKSYDVKKIHSFAQFQCILHQINSLNTLCASPFENTIYSKCYNGTFIYNIALKLEKQLDPAGFLEQYIKGASTVILLYKSICSVYNDLLQKMSLSTVQWSGKKKRGRHKKNLDDLAFIVKGFESDVKI